MDTRIHEGLPHDICANARRPASDGWSRTSAPAPSDQSGVCSAVASGFAQASRGVAARESLTVSAHVAGRPSGLILERVVDVFVLIVAGVGTVAIVLVVL